MRSGCGDLNEIRTLSLVVELWVLYGALTIVNNKFLCVSCFLSVVPEIPC